MYERLFKSAPSNIQWTDGIVNCGLWYYQLWLCVLAAVCAVELSTNLREGEIETLVLKDHIQQLQES